MTEESKGITKRLGDFAESLRKIKRGMQGLPIKEEDIFSGLINVKDLRERTRVSEIQIWSHSYMRIMADLYPDVFKIFKEIAEMEDTYYIAEDGEQRKEAILMQKVKSTLQVQAMGEALQLPKVETKPPEEPKKRGIFRRG